MTYSLAVTGANAASVPQALNLTVDDSAARNGSAQNAMMLGTPFLCKDNDGSSRYYVYDAERSNPEKGIRILRRLA